MGIHLRAIHHLKPAIIRQSCVILPVNANDSSMIYPAVTQDRNSQCCVIKCFKNVIREMAPTRQGWLLIASCRSPGMNPEPARHDPRSAPSRPLGQARHAGHACRQNPGIWRRM